MSSKSFIRDYSLTLGLPQTNMNGFSEVALLMHAGHFQWSSLAQAIGRPLSSLRTPQGLPVYFTYYYVEEQLPADRPLSGFLLDQSLRFLNTLRHFKSATIDGELVFEEVDRLRTGCADEHAFKENPKTLIGQLPYLRLCNVIICPEGGNNHLKMITLPDVSFDRLPPVALETNAYTITRQAAREQSFGNFEEGWLSLDRAPGFAFTYVINADRDTNGAGLVYFANYIAFLDMAERAALAGNSTRSFTGEQVHGRRLRKRQIAYYGNAGLADHLKIEVQLFDRGPTELGVRSKVFRGADGKLIALSEAIKEMA